MQPNGMFGIELARMRAIELRDEAGRAGSTRREPCVTPGWRVALGRRIARTGLRMMRVDPAQVPGKVPVR